MPSLHIKLFIPGNSAHVFPFLAPTAALRGKVETKEAEYPWPGSPGVPPDPSLELCQPGEVTVCCLCSRKTNRPLLQYLLLSMWFQGKPLKQVRGEKVRYFLYFQQKFFQN